MRNDEWGDSPQRRRDYLSPRLCVSAVVHPSSSILHPSSFVLGSPFCNLPDPAGKQPAQESQIRPVVLDDAVRRGGLNLNSAAVMNLIQRLADSLEVDASPAEHELAVFEVELADQVAQQGDFLVDIEVFIGRIADVVVHLDGRRADPVDDPPVVPRTRDSSPGRR